MVSLISKIGQKAAWLSFVLVILICFDVTFRYLFNDTQVWMIELEWYLFGILFLLCGAWSWMEDRHVRVDVFYQKFSPKTKNNINRWGHVLLGLPWLAIVIYSSFKYAGYSLRWNEGSPDPGGLPARYIVKYMMTLGFVLMFIVGIHKLFFDSRKNNKS